MNATLGREAALDALCRRVEWIVRAVQEGRMSLDVAAGALDRAQATAGTYGAEIHVCPEDDCVSWHDADDSEPTCGGAGGAA